MFKTSKFFRLSTYAAALLGMVVAFSGCEEKGPLEKAGENIDKAAENAKDAVDPRGPVEKAGAKVDDAVGK